ncbi:DUF481 domain-containing protein [Chromatocurvus halotolerans]|uniref:Uncharacterized protein DUF481 n=1 Tax=Chromatocurvus halotolerans TaxID=1132028 RepID=A0A4R2KMQ4_9GAMM|nr:DUF481 domain-containing protein [Chromatocurvus halotolerans]TCO75401.1 uncharacterized protein DUF481 [Chromatocurvus halotolerans]
MSRRRTGIIAALATFWLAVNAVAQEMDRVELKNGSTVYGEVVDAENGTLSVKTDFAGTIQVRLDQIASMYTETPMVLQMADGSIIEARPLAVEDERLVLPEAIEEGGGSYALSQLLRVNPEPWETGEGYRWNGLASGALSAQRGNTETNELDYNVESRWTGLDDRYSTRVYGQVRDVNGTRRAENVTFTSKYDRFLDNDWYWGMSASAERDQFSNIDLRAYVGPYLGKKFDRTPFFILETELGLSYVSEQFTSSPDEEYPGAVWTLDATSRYFGDDLRVYVRQNGIWDLDDRSDVVINSTAGMSFPLIADIEGSAEVSWEYDSGAVATVEELNQIYRFRIGYRW